MGARLGAGSVGVVRRARDTVRDVDVAIKTLRLPSGVHLYRFKREFRALADIAHPNLVRLHALEASGDEWNIVMELIDGVELLDWVRAPGGAAAAPPGEPGERGEATRPLAPAAPQRQRGPLDVDRLRASLRQLAQAVLHLHRLERLHRDIKPSNVLVEASGRVVLCDFGLVVERDRSGSDELSPGRLVGTPPYVSPEQAAGAALTEASDWYSVGVLLYEALAGRLPFIGALPEVLAQKQHAQPPPPSSFAAVPPELEQLCLALLQREPARRPSGDEVLRALDVPRPFAPEVVSLPGRFVGRQQPLAMMASAFADMRAGERCVAVLVQGASGLGKSHLLRRFVAELQREEPALVVLEGRCFPRESVRYKTLDPLVDALSGLLMTRSRAEVERALPRDAATLVHLFPVLERAPAIAELARATPAPPLVDPADSRRRAFAALRHLLATLARERPMVVVLDDLHWGDADSAPFLEDLLAQPAGLPLLLLGAICADDVKADSPARLLLRREAWSDGRDLRTIQLGALADSEARGLAMSIVGVGGGGDGDGAATDAIVREAGGNPLLVCELSRLAATGAGTAAVSLEELLTRRLEALTPDALALLGVLTVAGHPLSVLVAGRAAALDRPDVAVAELCAAGLVLRRADPHAEMLSLQFDRIRTVLLARSDAATLAASHRGLAEALEALGGAAPDQLVEHWAAGGAEARAAELALVAAGKAEAALAFHAAARYLERAITLRPAGSAVDLAVLVRLAEALELCGRPGAAAEAFRRAAQVAAGDAAIELEVRAVEQYLRAGHEDEGMALAEQLMPRLGLARVPPTRGRAVLALLAGRLRLWLRGTGFTERPAAEVSRDELRRADVLWSLTSVLGFNDPIRGAAMQTRHLRQALGTGDVQRAVRALAIELGYLSLAGLPHKAEQLAPSVLALAERSDDPGAVGQVIVAIGIGAFVSGQWRRAERHLTRGRELVMRHARGLRWELDLSNSQRLAALLNLGELAQLTRAVPQALREAEQQGNHYAASTLRAWRSNQVWLILGDPDEAWRNTELAGAQPRAGRHNPQEYYNLITRMHIELYRGDGEAAWRRIEEAWPLLRGAMIQRFPNMFIEIGFLHARAALASATGAQRAQRLAFADKIARKLRRAPLPWGRACGELCAALVALARGQHARAIDGLVSAELAFDGVDMALLGAVTRHARGVAMGGDAGAALSGAATRWMVEQRVADPARFAGVYVPQPAGSR